MPFIVATPAIIINYEVHRQIMNVNKNTLVDTLRILMIEGYLLFIRQMKRI